MLVNFTRSNLFLQFLYRNFNKNFYYEIEGILLNWHYEYL